MKLKYSEIAPYRQQQLREQEYRCALCLEPVIDDAVLDHDHKSGLLRKVLHRGCNSLLGKIENNLPRSRMTLSRLTVFTQQLIEYITIEHTKISHPTHLTQEEKKMKKTMGMGRGRGKGKKPPKR
jgi:hypothetical protein